MAQFLRGLAFVTAELRGKSDSFGVGSGDPLLPLYSRIAGSCGRRERRSSPRKLVPANPLPAGTTASVPYICRPRDVIGQELRRTARGDPSATGRYHQQDFDIDCFLITEGGAEAPLRKQRGQLQ